MERQTGILLQSRQMRNPGYADHLLRQHGDQIFRNTGIGGRLGLESLDGMPGTRGRLHRNTQLRARRAVLPAGHGPATGGGAGGVGVAGGGEAHVRIVD